MENELFTCVNLDHYESGADATRGSKIITADGVLYSLLLLWFSQRAPTMENCHFMALINVDVVMFHPYTGRYTYSIYMYALCCVESDKP